MACCQRIGATCRVTPPHVGAEAASDADVTPRSQTTSVKNAENGLLRAKWSAFWAQQWLTWCSCSHVNPLLRVVTRCFARKPAIWSVGGAAQARISGLTCGLEGPRANWLDNDYVAWLVSAANGTKVALRAHFGHNRAVFLEQGELCHARGRMCLVLGECCRDRALGCSST